MPTLAQRGDLIDTAAGRTAADLVLRNVRLINVLTREIHPADIAIRHGFVAGVANPGTRSWTGPEEDLGGLFVAPGFMDPHVHIESSLLTVGEYARAAVRRGVTTVAIDPHEMANVLGTPGMKLMLEEARTVALRIMLRVPGRIPAMPAWLETSGASLDVPETIDMLDWPEAVCLAGDINPALLIRKDADQLAKIEAARARRMTVAGQSPGLAGFALNAYVAAGPEDSHVAASLDEIIANQRVGLRSIIAIRRQLLHRPELRELARHIAETNMETRFLQFCTDDVNAHELIDVGHIDTRVRIAIDEGLDPLIAYQMATINVAEGLRLDQSFGAVSPGKVADLVVVGELRDVDVRATMIGGRWAYGRDGCAEQATSFSYPAWARATMRVDRIFTAQDMRVSVPGGLDRVSARSIGATMPKTSAIFELEVREGIVLPDPAQGVSSIAVIDRHTASGRIGRGFVSTLYVERGALASTVSHDAHNLMVIGASHEDMAMAANRAVANGGGYVVVRDGEILFELPLPVAGLMSELPIETVAAQARGLVEVIHGELGVPRVDDQILHQIVFLPLPNIPDFGFTDFGLIATDTLEVLDTVGAPAYAHAGCGSP